MTEPNDIIPRERLLKVMRVLDAHSIRTETIDGIEVVRYPIVTEDEVKQCT